MTTASEKAQLTKDIKAAKEHLAELEKHYDPRNPGQSYYLGEFVSRATIHQAKRELMQMMIARERMGTGRKPTSRSLMLREIKENLENGVVYQNDRAGYQYVNRADGTMLKYANGKYTFYTDINKMAKAVLKSLNTGR
jgi:hypothetical protein